MPKIVVANERKLLESSLFNIYLNPKSMNLPLFFSAFIQRNSPNNILM